MRLSDDIWALIFLVLAIALIVSGWQFDALPGQRVGAGTFPLTLGCVLGICSLVLYWTKGRHQRSQITLAQWIKSPRSLSNFLTVLGALIFFAWSANTLGYHLSVFICVTLMLAKFGSTWQSSVFISLVVTVVSHIFFYKALRVPLPWGLLPVIY